MYAYVRWISTSASVAILIGALAGCGGNEHHPRSYEVVLDAGSSGTRAFIYEIYRGAHGRQQVTLSKLSSENHKVKKSLDTPEGVENATQLITNINQVFADNGIPTGQATINVLATAGMRRQSPEAQAATYQRLRDDAARKGFDTDRGRFETISGHDEGTYAWTAQNLSKLDANIEQTVGIYEVGGASTQIAFADASLPVSANTVKYDINGKTYSIFSHSLLGLGADRARSKNLDAQPDDDAARNACYPAGYQASNAKGDSGRIYQIDGTYNGDMCRARFASVYDDPESPAEMRLDPLLHVANAIRNQSFVGVSTIAHSRHFLLSSPLIAQSAVSPSDYTQTRVKLDELCSKPYADLQAADENERKFVHKTCANTQHILALGERLSIPITAFTHRPSAGSPDSWTQGFVFIKLHGKKLS